MGIHMRLKNFWLLFPVLLSSITYIDGNNFYRGHGTRRKESTNWFVVGGYVVVLGLGIKFLRDFDRQKAQEQEAVELGQQRYLSRHSPVTIQLQLQQPQQQPLSYRSEPATTVSGIFRRWVAGFIWPQGRNQPRR